MEKKSFVHFKNGQIVKSTNDGMEILGHFLLTQVGAKGDFFSNWAKNNDQGEISSGPYFLVKKDDIVELSHLERSSLQMFSAKREQFIDIVTSWEGFCKNDAYSVCSIDGYELVLHKDDDNNFTFQTYKG